MSGANAREPAVKARGARTRARVWPRAVAAQTTLSAADPDAQREQLAAP